MTAVVERVDGTRNGRVAALLAGGVDAHARRGDLRAARELFDAARREAERLDDSRAMAEAAIGMCGLWRHEGRTFVDVMGLRAGLGRALALADPRSPVALRLRARLAAEIGAGCVDPTTVVTLVDEARAGADPVARAEVFTIAHQCLPGPEHRPLRQTLATELVEASFHTGRRSDLLIGLLWRAAGLLSDADPHAGSALGELRTVLAHEEHRAVRWAVDAVDVMLAVRADDLDRAEASVDACARRGRAAGLVDAEVWYPAQLTAIRWYQGRVVEVLPMLTEVVESSTVGTMCNTYQALLAVAAAAAGDTQRAASALASLCHGDLTRLPRSGSWLITMHGIATAAHLLDDANLCAKAHELLSPYAGYPVLGGTGAVCFGSVDHVLGLASLTTGDLDRAIDHFRAAVRSNLALAHRPALRASRRELAGALARRGQLAGADEMPAGTTARCTRDGQLWYIAWGRRKARVEHRTGLPYLAALVANPGQEILALDLAAGLSAPAGPGPDAAPRDQPVLDAAAVRAYRDRLDVLRSEIDRRTACGDTARAARARTEHDWITNELAGAAGLAGRVRAFPNDQERARTAVGKAIRRAISHIGIADPVIGEHLAAAVRTGHRCSYRPA